MPGSTVSCPDISNKNFTLQSPSTQTPPVYNESQQRIVFKHLALDSLYNILKNHTSDADFNNIVNKTIEEQTRNRPHLGQTHYTQRQQGPEHGRNPSTERNTPRSGPQSHIHSNENPKNQLLPQLPTTSYDLHEWKLSDISSGILP